MPKRPRDGEDSSSGEEDDGPAGPQRGDESGSDDRDATYRPPPKEGEAVKKKRGRPRKVQFVEPVSGGGERAAAREAAPAAAVTPPQPAEEDEGGLDAADDVAEDAEFEAQLAAQREAEAERMQHILASFDEQQLDRYEHFRRSTLARAGVKKLATTVVGAAPSVQTLIVLAGLGKQFVGELVEEARRVVADLTKRAKEAAGLRAARFAADAVVARGGSEEEQDRAFEAGLAQGYAAELGVTGPLLREHVLEAHRRLMARGRVIAPRVRRAPLLGGRSAAGRVRY